MQFSGEMQKYVEKDGIKSMSRGIGLTLIGYFLVMTGWSFIYLKIAAVFGLNIKQSLSLAADPMGENILQVIVSLIMVLVPSLVFCRVSFKKPSQVMSFSKPKGRILSIFAAGLGFCYFASAATEIAGSFFEEMGISVPSPEIQDPEGIFGFLMSVIVTALIPALIEEFSMRGIVMGVLRKYGDGFAIICSAVTFGLMHASAEQMPFAALVGLALGFVAVKTGSLWVSVAIHAANNLLCVLFSYASKIFEAATYNYIEIGVNVVILLAFIVGVCDISAHDDDFFSLPVAETTLKEREKLLAFFISPAFIFASVVAIMIAIFLR
ncbi:MAG: CPBP family intramembrane metalloprotease [Clostridiales bacterium]|nr:CPBP family intramembrane metalloprotease [Candidatus Equinaster intestinalis]